MNHSIYKPLKDQIDFDLQQDGTFGVEIECEGRDLPHRVKGWNTHREGSLRGDGMEYVTTGAVTLDQLRQAMMWLNQGLKNNDAIVKEHSHRASTHIHYNMQQASTHDVVGAIIAFTLVEPIFMRLCGPNRDGNLFCLPSYDCGDMPGFLELNLEHMRRNGRFYFRLERGKYSALNLNPLTTFGTLEFRTFPCSVKTEKVLLWASWVHQIVTRIRQCEHPSYRTEIFQALKAPRKYLNELFGAASIELFSDFELLQGIRVGAETAYECSRIYHTFLEDVGILEKAA